MKKKFKYTGKLQSGKEVKGSLEIKSHRKLAKELNEIGEKLLKRYPRKEMPLTEFKLTKA